MSCRAFFNRGTWSASPDVPMSDPKMFDGANEARKPELYKPPAF